VNKYLGKYRGTVTDNVDPMQIGRLMVQVPDVLNTVPSTWAMPCFPFGGAEAGMYVLPAIGSGVWVEFEQGNPDYPIWVGCYWGSSDDVPSMALAGTPGLQAFVVQTTNQNMLVVSDMPGPTGGILLQSSTGALIAINDTGITIDNGQGATIILSGPSVTVNDGALQVT
jgi:uncharacterized protein involved in type VI secretion and phage assembly